jgi:hypothetical protein
LTHPSFKVKQLTEEVIDPGHRLAPIWFPLACLWERGSVNATICRVKEIALAESLSSLPFFLPPPRELWEMDTETGGETWMILYLTNDRS